MICSVFSILLLAFCVRASDGPWMVIGKVLYEIKKIIRDTSSQDFVLFVYFPRKKKKCEKVSESPGGSVRAQ